MKLKLWLDARNHFLNRASGDYDRQATLFIHQRMFILKSLCLIFHQPFSIILPLMKTTGETIRSIRKKKHWTLRRLASETSLSISFLSQVERGISTPSMPSLNAICKALSLSLTQLVAIRDGVESFPFVKRQVQDIVTIDEQPSINVSDGSIRYRFLSGTLPDRIFECLIGEIPPGHSTSQGSHAGEEFGYVLEGILRLTLNQRTYSLKKGDSYHIKASTPHAYTAQDTSGATILWVQTLKYNLGFQLNRDYVEDIIESDFSRKKE